MSLLPFGVALGIALGSIPLIRPLAARFGFVDHPTGRKVHVTPIPLGGGLGLVLGLGLGTLSGIVQSDMPFAQRPVLAWLAGLIVVVLVGLKDDRSPMSPLPKLAGQIVAALVLVLGTGVPAPGALGGLAVPLAVVAAVALMNACNFLDNMDGILGGIAVVCGFACALLAPAGSAAAQGAAPRSASWPTTSFRRGSSWATRARWRWATPWRRSRSRSLRARSRVGRRWDS
jgi:UDP-GlcNAc:undecaprenyl-phosphate GlcNAc-1-phosphate transferase